jgi:hypothetical protein
MGGSVSPGVISGIREVLYHDSDINPVRSSGNHLPALR